MVSYDFLRCILILLLTTMVVVTKADNRHSSRPNIVLIIADDMGWDDVSFHGSDQILTPNIDLLAYTGVALERYYSHCICTPTRSALLTGKYSHVTGMQGYPLSNSEDRGLPLTEKILPQYLKELGYATHLVGKWHVGQSRTDFLPTMRGFDTHYGHRGGFIDYYEYTLQEPMTVYLIPFMSEAFQGRIKEYRYKHVSEVATLLCIASINRSDKDGSGGEVTGLGLFRNMTAVWGDSGYVTDLYTKEAERIISSHDESTPLFLTVAHNAPHSGNAAAVLQASPEDVRSMRHVESPQRRIFGAMVKKLDESVGIIVNSLLEKGILNNTIIAFISDNGGMTTGDSMNYASNWPLRGIKMSPFEGGVRVNGLLWTKNLTDFSHLWKGYMHVSDWLPTLLKAAGGEAPVGLDGLDLWENIMTDEKSKREELFEIDDVTGYYSIILGDYKLVMGYVTVNFSNHQGEELRRVIGNTPPYLNSLKNSIMYKVLSKIDKPFNFEKTKIRDEIKIMCNEIKNRAEDLCYPQNNLWCLYNIKEDPCEVHDVSSQNPEIVQNMVRRLRTEMARVKPREKNIYRDPRSSPRLHNNTWDVWADNFPVY